MQSIIKAFLINILLGLNVFVFVNPALAQSILLPGAAPQVELTKEQVLMRIVDQANSNPGAILILGEEHNNPQHAQHQMEIIHGLQHLGLKVHVGMEFVDFTQQQSLEQYRRHEISETNFLQQIAWTGFDFANYREQILAPQEQLSEHCYGINSPRSLTSKVSKKGLESLTTEDRKLLPPQFTLGRSSYKERFSEVMGGHIPPEKLDRYFAAQSIWDDTMAYQSLLAYSQQLSSASSLARTEKTIFVIVVGEFHVQYGGGLPDRLQTRMYDFSLSVSDSHLPMTLPIITMSFLDQQGMDKETQQQETQPHAKWGSRADYLWVLR